jgi:hypothetical protein
MISSGVKSFFKYSAVIAVVLFFWLEGISFAQLREARTLFQWRDAPEPQDPDDSLNSDRPSFTPNSTTLGKNIFQVETGYLYTREASVGEPTINSHQLPETQLRWGVLADWLEFRMSQAFLGQEEAGVYLNGASDTQVGLSLALTSQQGFLPESAFIPVLFIPSGSSWATDGSTRGGAALSYSWGFLEDWTLGASTQMYSEVDSETAEAFLATYQSCYLKKQLGEKTSVFGEWYASFPHNATSEVPSHFLDTGILILLKENLQWDARVGTGLSETEPEFFVGTGLSIRFR